MSAYALDRGTESRACKRTLRSHGAATQLALQRERHTETATSILLRKGPRAGAPRDPRTQLPSASAAETDIPPRHIGLTHFTKKDQVYLNVSPRLKEASHLARSIEQSRSNQLYL